MRTLLYLSQHQWSQSRSLFSCNKNEREVGVMYTLPTTTQPNNLIRMSCDLPLQHADLIRIKLDAGDRQNDRSLMISQVRPSLVAVSSGRSKRA